MDTKKVKVWLNIGVNLSCQSVRSKHCPFWNINFMILSLKDTSNNGIKNKYLNYHRSIFLNNVRLLNARKTNYILKSYDEDIIV